EPRRNEAERRERGEFTGDGEPERIPMSTFLAEFYRTPTAVLLIVAYFGAQVVGLVFLTWMPTFLKEKFHLNLAAAGLGATFFIQTASMVGCSAGGILADRWRTRFPGGRILTQAFGALFGAPFLFFCGYTHKIGLLM